MGTVPARSIGRRRNLAVFVGLLALLVPTRAASAGQVAAAASIIGQVTDESGAVLPGVTVTARSSTLQVGSLASVTDERGEYRLTPLPLGVYVVDYELPGFQQVRHEDVRLTTGFVAKLDVTLKVGSLQETVTVSGASPVVDVTSTATTRRFTTEELDLAPSSRNSIIGLLALAPAVRMNLDVAGNSFTTIPAFRAYGQSQESYTSIEGVFITALKGGGGNGSYLDYATVEESQVNTSASDADMPTRGVQLGVVVKSGGNAFHGGGFWGQTSSGLQSDNLDDRLRGEGLTSGNRLVYRRDGSGELGGRIIRDKLWFYGSGRSRAQSQEVLGALKDDGSPAENVDRQELGTAKISYQMNQKSRLIGFFQENHKYALSTDRFTSWEARGLLDSHTRQAKAEWQFVPTSKLVISLQQGVWNYLAPKPTFSTAIATEDIGTGWKTGESTSSGDQSFMRRHHTTGKISWYQPDAFLGNHEFKLGFDFMDNTGSDGNPESRQSANYRLKFNNGVPLEIEHNNYPVTPKEKVHYTALYATDTWTIQRRLTLNVGLRYARDAGFVPGQCRVAPPPPADQIWPGHCYDTIRMKVFNPISPRARAAWDVFGNGRTSLKGGWGRYTHLRQLFGEVDQIDPQGQQYASFRWHDLNNNLRYDVGEVNFNPNGPDFVGITTSYAGLGETLPNPDEKQPLTDELSIAFERELMANFAVRVTGIASRTFNLYRTTNLRRPYSAYNIPVTKPDPGPDGRLNTTDDPGQSITYFEYSPALSGKSFELQTLTNASQPAWYKTIEMSAVKRFAGKWMASASYAATKINSPLGATSVYAAVDNPNAEINIDNQTWEWMGKASGAYSFPAGIMASMNFEHRSGDPWSRTVNFTGGVLSSIRLPVEPFGTRRLPNINIVDFRVNKTFRLTAQQNIELRANLYNVLNANTAINVGRNSGSSFLRTTAITPPRIWEFAANYRF